MAWGEKGEGTAQKPETRPGYFNSVHGIAVDPVAHEVFVNDRNNRRIQVFDESGKFLPDVERRRAAVGRPPDHHGRLTQHLGGRSRHVEDGEVGSRGQPRCTWGTWGDFPGGMWGVHGLSIDSKATSTPPKSTAAARRNTKPRAGAQSDVPAHEADPRRPAGRVKRFQTPKSEASNSQGDGSKSLRSLGVGCWGLGVLS